MFAVDMVFPRLLLHPLFTQQVLEQPTILRLAHPSFETLQNIARLVSNANIISRVGKMSMEQASEDVQSSVSDASSATPTSQLDSRSHIARPPARTTKEDRRQSLGLIDAARVRLSIDVSPSTRPTPALITRPGRA